MRPNNKGGAAIMEDANTPAKLSPLHGFYILLLVLAIIVGWIAIGSMLLGITSFFASFLFLWYWAAVEQADFKQWPQCLAGALFGLLLAWASHYLPVRFGGAGLGVALALLVAAVYVQIMNWAPQVCNRSAMLFLTVLAAPALLEKLNLAETALAITGGALFVGGVVKLAMMAVARKG
jgi:hypothetical protein